MRGFRLAPAGPAQPPPLVHFTGSLPSSQLDVQVNITTDEGGDPGTVKIIAMVINQAHPNSPAHTILLAACPFRKDKYDELAAILDNHPPPIDFLLRDGIRVRGVTRPVP